MKFLLKTILDGLTYTDLAGKRQPRIYTAMTGLILLLLLAVLGMGGFNRFLLMRAVQSTPEKVQIPTGTIQPVKTSVPTTETTQVDDSPISSTCPTDPAAWSFTPTVISSTHQVIQPACVYLGLEKTIAWALAVREGYSRSEATELLGFNEMPIEQIGTVTIPKDADDFMSVPVSFIPPEPGLQEWRLNSQGGAAVTYALRGCFRTSTVKGNQLETWGGEFPVICLVAEDAENSHIVYSVNGYTHTSAATPMRSFLLFGYRPDGPWVWLGTRTEPRLEITNQAANANERLTVSTLYDSHPWDSEWLEDFYHLSMQSPPDNWQNMTDEQDRQAILSLLSRRQP